MKSSSDCFKVGDIVNVVSKYNTRLEGLDGSMCRVTATGTSPYLVSVVMIKPCQNPMYRTGEGFSIHNDWLELDKQSIVKSIIDDL